MVAPTSSSSSSSSSFGYGWTYDVFLSFRGQDTRYGFTGNLYNALIQKGIRAFIDDEELRRGNQITPSLLKAIEESRIAVVVLSNNYASSSFCLDELVHILRCFRGNGRLVLPVFYDADPSDVRRQTGSYGEALPMHEHEFKANKEKLEVNMERLKKWEMALHHAANLSGYHFKFGDGYEYEFIRRIVEEVSGKINRIPFHVADCPVGLESRVLEVNSLLDVGSDVGVHMVGIYGIGGIGKTTVARALYNLIADQFEGLCFLDDVRENSIKHGLVHLQETLLSEIVGEKDIKLGSVNKGISIIKRRLNRKKILLILDDVDKLKHLQALFGGPDWFGPGTRVIITTRDKHLLVCHGVERIYEVEGLNKTEALELLSWKVFKTDQVDPGYMDVLNLVVTYASGLPLALEVIGSCLFGKSIEQWKSALDKYKRIPNVEIQKILKVSFDSLEEEEQSVFLDIACCFKGYDLAEVEDILGAHYGVCMKYHIGMLVEKSLIKIEYDHVTLHDLIQEMGKEIVRQESPREPGHRSRLWFSEDIIQVLEKNMGTSKIQMIILNFPKSKEVVEWDGKAFKKMKSLKTLIIRKGRFSEGPKHLPNSLRVLEWWEYPSPSLPFDFHPKELAIFKLPCICFMSLGLHKLLKKLVNLKVLNFSYSRYITEIPNVSGAPNLEELSFGFCVNLIKIHKSVGFLDKLRILNSSGCRKLRSFPSIKLTSLEQLNLSFCSNLEAFPEILGKMENITQLYLEQTPIKKLPFSIQNLTRLRRVDLDFCGIVQLPSSIVMLPKLNKLSFVDCDGLLLPKQNKGEEHVSSMVFSNTECLDLSNCNVLDEFLPRGLASFPNVKELDLSMNYFTILPACIKECHFLRKLNLNYCENLREIRGIPPSLEIFSAQDCPSLKDLDLTLLPVGTIECHFLRVIVLDGCENLREIRGILPSMEYFSAMNCRSLTSSCRSILLNEELHVARDKYFILPGTMIPRWFEHRSKGGPICFWFRRKFPVIALCVVIGASNPIEFFIWPKLIINGNIVGKEFRNKESTHYSKVDHIFIFDLNQIIFEDKVDEVLLENEWNHVVVYIDILDSYKGKSKDVSAMQIGLHVFRQKSSTKDIRFSTIAREGQSVSAFLKGFR